MKPKAHILLRVLPHYRSDAFAAGAEKLGYVPRITVSLQPGECSREDAVVVWNLHGRGGIAKKVADDAGAPVIVAENGYVGKDKNDWQYYAVALDGHCGSGRWPDGGSERWEALRQTVAPWRDPPERGHVLICGQRGIGSPEMASPRTFLEDTAAKIRKHTKYRVKERPHPGRVPNQCPLDEDLDAARLVVVWSSNVSSRALLRGIPVMYCAPHIITQGAATKLDLSRVDDPPLPDRLPVFHRLAWAQWSVAEIASGLPMKLLLEQAGRSS